MSIMLKNLWLLGSLAILASTLYIAVGGNYLVVFTLGFLVQMIFFVACTRLQKKNFDPAYTVFLLCSLAWLVVFCIYVPNDDLWDILFFVFWVGALVVAFLTVQCVYINKQSFQKIRTTKSEVVSLLIRELTIIHPAQYDETTRFDQMELNEDEVNSFVNGIGKILKVPLEKSDLTGTIADLASRICHFCQYLK